MPQMFDDRTEFRNNKKDKALWKAAAAKTKAEDLSDWMRRTLTWAANIDICLPDDK